MYLKEIWDANNNESNQDDEHPKPAEPLEPPSEQEHAKNADKDEDWTSEHLERRGAGQSECNVHDGGCCDIAESWW